MNLMMYCTDKDKGYNRNEHCKLPSADGLPWARFEEAVALPPIYPDAAP